MRAVLIIFILLGALYAGAKRAYEQKFPHEKITSNIFYDIPESTPVLIKEYIPGNWDCALVAGPYFSPDTSIGGISLKQTGYYSLEFDESQWLLILVTQGEVTHIVNFDPANGPGHKSHRFRNKIKYILLNPDDEKVAVVKGKYTTIQVDKGVYSIAPGAADQVSRSCL